MLPLEMRPPERLHAMAAASWLSAYRPVAGDVVVDAGAGVGTETFVFSQLVGPTGRVIAFEPHPVLFARLERLCTLSRLENVVLFDVALGDEPATALIDDLETGLASIVGGTGTLEVRVDTLDRILDELGVERVDLLKMNIEGAETLALSGFARGLAATANVVVACHDFLADEGGPDTFRTKVAVRSALESHGFVVTDGPTDADPWDRDRLYGRADETAWTRRTCPPTSVVAHRAPVERHGGGGGRAVFRVPRADEGTRTLDLRLGKPTLYQLSYVRAARIVPPASSTAPQPGIRRRLDAPWRTSSTSPIGRWRATLRRVPARPPPIASARSASSTARTSPSRMARSASSCER